MLQESNLRAEKWRATRLEPATSCMTGRRSNQLNYVPANSLKMTSRALHSLAVSCTPFHVLRRDGIVLDIA